MHVKCEPASGQHVEFDFNVNTVCSEEWLFLKRLLSVNNEVRSRWSALCYHHNALYNIIRQKAANMLEGICGKDIYEDDMVSWSSEYLETIKQEELQVSTADCALFYEEIGGVLITDKNLIGFHYRKHYTYDPTPRLVGDVDYPTCDTIDCDIFGQDEERRHKRAHYSKAWCGVLHDCAYLTIEYFNGDRVQMVTVREEQRCGEASKMRSLPKLGSLYDCAERMRRVIRIKRRNQPNADPTEISRLGEPMPEIYLHAWKICKDAHKGQKDKAGEDYSHHPFRVAEKCQSFSAKVVALLHDTIEDTEVTVETLQKEGFSQDIINGVLSVTKRDGESYEDFVRRAAENPLGREVKKADLEDNMDIHRLKEISDEDVARLRKYLRAWQYLITLG